MAGSLQAIFRRIRAMRDLTEDDIKCLVQEVLKRDMPIMTRNAVRLEPLTAEEHEAALKDAEETTAKFKQLLGRSDYFPVEAYARAMLKEHDLQAPDGSLAFKQLCHHLMKAGLRLSEADLKMLSGDYSFERNRSPATPGGVEWWV
jgi:hypothetical protein